jgi:hypothetical protein
MIVLTMHKKTFYVSKFLFMVNTVDAGEWAFLQAEEFKFNLKKTTTDWQWQLQENNYMY